MTAIIEINSEEGALGFWEHYPYFPLKFHGKLPEAETYPDDRYQIPIQMDIRHLINCTAEPKLEQPPRWVFQKVKVIFLDRVEYHWAMFVRDMQNAVRLGEITRAQR